MTKIKYTWNEQQKIQKNIRLFFENILDRGCCKYCGNHLDFNSEFKNFCNRTCNTKYQWQNPHKREMVSSKVRIWNIKRIQEHPELRQSLTAGMHGKESRERAKETMLKRYASGEIKIWSKDLTKETDVRVKQLGESRLGINNPIHRMTIESKLRRKEKTRDFYIQHPEKHPNIIMMQKGFISKPQKELYATILLFDSSAVLEFPIITKSGVKFLDVAIPSKKIGFEFDGKHWHKDVEKDKKREQMIVDEGWTLLRFNEDNMNTCYQTVENLLRR